MTPFLRRWDGPGRALYLHCALAHAGVLTPLATSLGGGFGIDLPGHGKSPPWDETLDYQAQCVAWAREAMPDPRPVIGHSFGATVALRLAVERPDLVTDLVLIEPVYFAAARLHDPDAYARYKADNAGVEAALATGDLHAQAEAFTTMWGGTPWAELPGRFKDTIAAQMPLIRAQWAGIDADSGAVFAPGALSRVTCPVTLIRGADTQPVVGAIHAVLAKLLPQSREDVVDGAGHMCAVTHPARVAALIQL